MQPTASLPLDPLETVPAVLAPADLLGIRAARASLGLGAQLAIAFAALCVLLTGLLVVTLERSVSGPAAAEIGARLQYNADRSTLRLDQSMFERYREIQLLARRLASAPPAVVRAEIEAAQATYPYYAWIGATDARGLVQAATGGLLVGQSVASRPWFAEGLKGPFVGDVHEAVLLAKLLDPKRRDPLRFFDFAFPLVVGGEVRGVLGAHLFWEWSKEIRPVVSSAPGEVASSEALIVASDGTVLHGPASVQGTRLDLRSLGAARAGRSGHLVETWPDGVEYVVGYSLSRGYRDTPGLGWTVLVRQEAAGAFAPLRKLQLNLIGASAALAVLFIAVGWFMARRITGPLLDLAESARRLEAGDIGKVRVRAVYPELGVLARAFNSLVVKLRGNEAALRALNAQLEERVRERTADLSRALVRVQASEQRIQTIVEASHDAFIGVDLQGRIIDWNSQAESMLGWAREEILGRSVAETLIPARYAASFEQALAQVATGQGRGALDRPLERLVVTRDGRELAVEAKLGLVSTGEETFFSAFLHDISQRKEVERLKDEFISTVSHELRTPLTAIHGAIRLLEQGVAGPLPPQAGRLVELAAQNSQRLRRIVDDILDLEKIASGRMQFERVALDAADVLERVAAACGVQAEAAGVALRVEAASPLRLVADAQRLQQVLANLLSNALKFAPRGSEVQLQALASPGTAGFVRLQVTDHGPGIPQEFRSRIFQRFAQAEAQGLRSQGSSGLGLSIAREMTEGMGGRIGYESEPGRTCFHIDLPMESP